MRRHSLSIAVASLIILLRGTTLLAADITCGQTLDRTIERGSKPDVISYAGGPGDVLSITVVPVTQDPDCKFPFDPYWELFDPDGQRVPIPLGDGDRRCLSSQGGQCETAPLPTASDLAPYLLVVTDFAKNCSGTYRVTVENVSGTVNGEPFPGDQPVCAGFNRYGKPDGTQPITRGEPVGGTIDDVGETDTFTFDGQLGETVTIALSPVSAVPGFDPRWTLFDPSGTALSDDCSALTCTRGPLVAGVYTIKVFDSDNDGAGDYTLQLQPEEPATTTTTTTSTTIEAPSTTTTTLIGGPGATLYELSRTLRRASTAEELGKALAAYEDPDPDQDWLVIGSPGDQTLGRAAGAAFVVSVPRLPTDPNYGRLLRSLYKPDGTSDDDRFGAAVALLAKTVAVGAPGAEASGSAGVVQDAGAVYLFGTDPNAAHRLDWQPVAGANFGATLTASDGELFVGAPAEGGVGRVYVFDGTTPVQAFAARDAAGSDPALAASAAPAIGDQFGFAIAADADQLAIGAPATDTGRAGRVFLYDRRSGRWQVVQSPAPSADDRFGSALTFVDSTLVIGAPGVSKVFKVLSADRPPIDFAPPGFRGLGVSLVPLEGNVLVGAPEAGDTVNGGAVLQLDLDGGPPQATRAKLQPREDDAYGAALAAAHNHVFIGAPGDDAGNLDAGAVYVYELGVSVDEAIFRKRLVDAGFGTSIAADATNIAVGAPTDAGGNGVVYTFHAQAACRDLVCDPFEHLEGSDGARFGQSVTMVDGATLIGAPFEDVNGNTDVGAAYLALPNRVGPTIANPEPSPGDQFGLAVATVESDVLVAAPLLGSSDTGAVFVFDKLDLRNRRLVLRKPVPGTGDFFGAAIAGEGDVVAVGAPFDGTAWPGAGAVYLFKRSSGELLTGKPLVSPDPMSQELFGAAVAVSADRIVVGAPSQDGAAARPGRVYVFERQSLNLLNILDNPSHGLNDRFGAAVAIINGQVLVGAPFTDRTLVRPGGGTVLLTDTGAAYLIDPASHDLLQTFENPARAAFDRFGASVGATPSGLMIGAPGPGRVYVYGPATASAAPGQTMSSGLVVRNALAVTAAASGARCGNGVVEGDELCDDGNRVDTDDCRNNCTPRCCVIDPLAADRCNDFDPCTEDGVDASGACVNVDNGQCCTSSSSCAGDGVCRLCSGCSLFPWDCCDVGATCLLNSQSCSDKECYDEAACECVGGLTCSEGSKPTDAMVSAFQGGCDDVRRYMDVETTPAMGPARTTSKEARKMLKTAVRETRNAYKDGLFSKKCRGEFLDDIRRVRKSVPVGQKLRHCVNHGEPLT